MKFSPLANPILIVGDNPALPGGLSRIGRDLASLLCTMPEFRVGYLGRGEGTRRRFPWVSYCFHESGQWGQDYIQNAWEDFADGSPGVILTTDDPSRRLWFADSRGCAPELQKFLGDGRDFQKLGYFPIDSTGPDGVALGVEGAACLAGYDRVLAASEWGRDVLARTGRPDSDWLPHGLLPTFHPVPHARGVLGLAPGQVMVGCVMANQGRKDFPAAFLAASLLRAHYGNRFKFWFHTDVAIRHWNVLALAADYGIGDCLEVTGALSDEALAVRYSACDATILPSAGEGFGYPIAESLSCGTACVVTDYAAGAELVGEDCRVKPVTFRVDTPHNVRRAVISGHGFAAGAMAQIEEKRADPEFVAGKLADSVAHLAWEKLRPVWERWFREGLRG